LKKEGYEGIVTINDTEAWYALQQPPYIIMLTIKDKKIDTIHGICPECMNKLYPKYTPQDTTI
jgi:hypothetical protein